MASASATALSTDNSPDPVLNFGTATFYTHSISGASPVKSAKSAVDSYSRLGSAEDAAEPARIEAVEVVGHRNDLRADLVRDAARQLLCEACLVLCGAERIFRAALGRRHQQREG